MAQESVGPWSCTVDWCLLVPWLALVWLGRLKSTHLCLNHIILFISDIKRWWDNKKPEANHATYMPPSLSPSIPCDILPFRDSSLQSVASITLQQLQPEGLSF